MEFWPQLGARTHDEGIGFCVWAPFARDVHVRIRDRDHVLEPSEDGVFSTVVDGRPGDEYLFVLDGRAWPDPCSRYQPEGIRGPSSVVASPGLRPLGLEIDELVLYELHVGTFSSAGTFDGVIEQLPRLRELGVTALELMPIATFPGERNWGYDGVYIYSPHPVYGGPEGLARLVAAAHANGLGVVLDVVYNHIGPGSEAIGAFGPYFTDRHQTFWGDAIDYAERGAREWAIQNAEMWVRDYGIDGLRVDATHAVFDDRRPHVLAELVQRVHALEPRTLVIAEMEVGDLRPIEEWGFDAQWADELHHVLHVLLTGERDGYYAGVDASVEELARRLGRRPPERLVVCSQNHDQVGNRALGDRPGPDELRVRAATVLLAPQTPLLFMGEEYGEQRPFRFFTDHIDPAIARATREGRKREFADFAAFSGDEIPDPQDPATFEASKLQPENGDNDLSAFYRRLLELRRTLPREIETEVDEGTGVLLLRRGKLIATIDFTAKKVELSGAAD